MFVIGEKGATSYWSGMEGLRHKYFVYDHETETCGGIYVFYNQGALDKYMASDLFKSHKNPEIMPHFNGQVQATVLDVMPGTHMRACTCTCVPASACACVHACTRAAAAAHTHTHTHTHTHVHTRMHARTYAHAPERMGHTRVDDQARSSALAITMPI